MLHHHKHGIKQSIFAFIVVFLVCTGMFLTLKPNLYSSAALSPSAYVPSTESALQLPDTNVTQQTNVPLSQNDISKSRSDYVSEPAGLPAFKVTSVIDGNTVVLEGIARIRLIGIKAPDTDEEYGIQATNYLKSLVDQKDVALQLDSQNPRDDFGRLRAIIYINNRNVNVEMLRAGLAHIFPTTPSIVGYDDWSYFENEAREAKRGLWSGEKPVLKENSVPSL